MNAIELHGVTKTFNGTVTVDDLSLAVMGLNDGPGTSAIGALPRRRCPPAPARRALQNHLT